MEALTLPELTIYSHYKSVEPGVPGPQSLKACGARGARATVALTVRSPEYQSHGGFGAQGTRGTNAVERGVPGARTFFYLRGRGVCLTVFNCA